jgi:hypothetical protein
MPETYRNLSADEMEYDGGVWNFVAAVACSAASFGLSVAAKVTGNKDLEYASYVLAGASIVLSFGATGIVNAGAKLTSKAAMKVGKKVFNPTNMGIESYQTCGQITTILSFPTDLTGFILGAKNLF